MFSFYKSPNRIKRNNERSLQLCALPLRLFSVTRDTLEERRLNNHKQWFAMTVFISLSFSAARCVNQRYALRTTNYSASGALRDEKRNLQQPSFIVIVEVSSKEILALVELRHNVKKRAARNSRVVLDGKTYNDLLWNAFVPSKRSFKLLKQHLIFRIHFQISYLKILCIQLCVRFELLFAYIAKYRNSEGAAI